MQTASCHTNDKLFLQTVSYFDKQQAILTSSKLFWETVSNLTNSKLPLQTVSNFDKQQVILTNNK